MITMDLRLGQMNQKLHEAAGEKRVVRESARSEGGHGQKDGVIGRDITEYLKGIKVDVPIFNGSYVHKWIYRIEKYLSIHSVPEHLRHNW